MQIPNDPSQADPSIIAAMHGIVAAEGSNGNPSAIGDNGTAAGIGQWSNEDATGKPQPLAPGEIPTNFQNDAKQYGLDPTDFSLANQNKVLYAVLAKDKADGLSPEEAFSKWNSGRANAYLNAPVEASSVSATGTSDVAAYVKRAMAAAQAYAQSQQGGLPQASSNQTQVTQNLPGMPSLPQAAQVTPTGNTPVQQTLPSGDSSQNGFLSDIAQGNYGGAATEGAKGLLNFAFPIVGDIGSDIQGKSNKTALQQAADAALSVLPFIPFVGEGGEALRAMGLGGQIALGAGAGALQGVSQGQNLQGIAGSAALGGVTGGVLSGAGNLLGKLSDALPQSIIRKFIPGLSADEAQYAATRPLGSLESMKTASDANLSKVGTSIGAALRNPQYDYVQPSGEEILNKVKAQFPEANLTNKQLASYLKKTIPLKSGLVNKLLSGQDMTLSELHRINSGASGLGAATFKRVFDDPTVRAGKDVGSALYHTISGVLKDSAPEVAPMFDNYAKENALNAGLAKAIRSSDKAKVIGLKEILAIMGGFSTMGIPGAAGAYALEKGVTSPTINLKTAGLLKSFAQNPSLRNKIGGLLIPQAARVAGSLPGLVTPGQ